MGRIFALLTFLLSPVALADTLITAQLESVIKTRVSNTLKDEFGSALIDFTITFKHPTRYVDEHCRSQSLIVRSASYLKTHSQGQFECMESGVKARFRYSVIPIVKARVPTESISRREPLEPTLFEEMEVEARLPSDLLLTIERGAYRAKTRLSQGSPVRRAHVEVVPAVSRGEVYTLVARQGGISARTEVEALEDAAIGQRVRVKNLATNIEFRANVIGKDQVGL